MKILFSLIFLSFWACRSTQVQIPQSQNCASFDIRQCQTDVFADQVSEAGGQAERENQMLAWLKSVNVDVVELKLELNYHAGVCEACDMCPTPDRYVLKINGDIPDLEKLRLLNFKFIDC